MTDNEINGSIAKSVGSVLYNFTECKCFDDCGQLLKVPVYADYCNDLNSMHEVEKEFDNAPIDVQSMYLDYLYCGVGWDDANDARDAKHKCHYGAVRATARQRAEAFLRVKGLWKEGK